MVNEFRTAIGGEKLGMSKQIVFIFKTWQKIVTQFGQFKKLKCREGSQFCKLSQLCYHFCRVLKMKIIFLNIPSYPTPIAVRNSLTNQFYQKNWHFCIFSTKKLVLLSASIKTFSFSCMQNPFYIYFWYMKN